ncbi:MAG: RecQ family ATP-dependent DNA helicase [Chitinophagaceae bacterium]|nr:RecQ family ATP-dependent DNA helicase [Chitinophagaceae bacterium]
MPDIQKILKQYWGFDSFRPLQKEIIESVLAKNDTVALLPTGGGKSVCFQVPALAQEGICLVVSPLIALMKDQVENLKRKNIHALSVYSGMSRTDIVKTLKNASYGNFKFLYISPERIETSLFQEYLPALNVNLIAVDEAHCISQWGYDFRPSYLRISALRDQLPRVPMLALTASATTDVQQDICEKLNFRSKNIFRQSFQRKNLSYSVFKVDSKISKLVEILKKVQGSAIVYCKSRKRTQEIHELLQMHGISSNHYHAGLLQADRNQRQEEWISNNVKVMVCTNAFGMGIDKPDVRVVVHIDVPDCLENYYQEAGRAGRDEKKSYAVLLYNNENIAELSELHEKRFPTFEEIKHVYNALINYLQIPVNTGEDLGYTFKFEEFTKNFKLDSTQALYALKALEQDGWLDFNEKNFSPSTVVFAITKEQLYEFEKAHPEYEQILTTLLRTYEGIFDYPAFVSENLLSRLLRKDETAIKTILKKISSFGIINYAPQNDAPQIIFRKNRVAANDLVINLLLYNKRRESFINRVEQIINYTKTNTCRSSFIGKYFGDNTTESCGICDNCLAAKPLNISAEEFEKINSTIQKALSEPLSASQLINSITGVPKEKARRVIDFLQAEKKLLVNQRGELYLTGRD